MLEAHDAWLKTISGSHEDWGEQAARWAEADRRHQEFLKQHELVHQKLDLKLLEIGKKLDALIHYVDQQGRKPPQQNGGGEPAQ